MSVQEPVFRENLVYAPVKHSFVLEASLFAFAVFVFMGGTPFQDADYSLLASLIRSAARRRSAPVRHPSS